jgi:hypothetical protein
LKKGHIADRCYKRFVATYKPPPSQPPFKPRASPQALCVQPGTAPPEHWYLNSGASAHVTSDLNALTAYSPYTGSDKLCVGDGKGLDILHIGSARLFSNSAPLLLTNVLHVPNISKSLLSVSQLLADNSVYVEFHANCCLIKDQKTYHVLLKGTKINGLYIIAPVFQALVCQKESSQL